MFDNANVVTFDVKFFNILKIILCLPESSALVERVLSIMNKIWTNEMSTLNFKTNKCLLEIKSNSEYNCSEYLG